MPKVALAVSRFNEEVTSALRDSCMAELAKHGLAGKSVAVFSVPGGYELPWLVQELALSKDYECVIALGCILKGETAQNEHIARSTIQHLHDIALATRVPCVLGVITPDTEAQALARTRGENDRGLEAAKAALELLALKKKLGGRRG